VNHDDATAAEDNMAEDIHVNQVPTTGGSNNDNQHAIGYEVNYQYYHGALGYIDSSVTSEPVPAMAILHGQ
jgi:hypothetical protein